MTTHTKSAASLVTQSAERQSTTTGGGGGKAGREQSPRQEGELDERVFLQSFRDVEDDELRTGENDSENDDDDDDFQDEDETGESNRLIGGQRASLAGAGDMFFDDEKAGAARRPGPTFAHVLAGHFNRLTSWPAAANSSAHHSSKSRQQHPQPAALRHSLRLNGGKKKHSQAPARIPPTVHRSHPAHSVRSTLLLLLFALLLACSLLVLIKLTSLVQQQRLKLLGGGEDLREQKQNLMGELATKLDAEHRKQLEAEQLLRWSVASSKCRIPQMEPWDESIKEYVHVKSAMNCSQVLADFYQTAVKDLIEELNTTTSTLTRVQDNRLFFEPAAIRAGALSGLCCYKTIARTIESDKRIEIGDECVPIYADGLAINQSLIQVVCAPPVNYANVHAFIVHNKEEEDALARVAQAHLNRDDYYNILIVGVDTVSRLNAQRQFKKTLDLLTGDLYQTLVFPGYNKVGENTFPNLVPLLTGLRPNQLVETECWMVKNYTDENEHGDETLDNCKYLWNFYQQVGYATYFSEDWPSASTFNYLKGGFRNEPTTYYGRPFALARESLVFPKFHAAGCASCQLDRPIVQIDLANLQAFVERHQERPYFAFHWINCPQHEDLNKGSQVDHLVEDFFARMHNITQNDKTFVFFLSDHGYRWEDFISTRIGHYEASLPLLTIAAPKSFIRKHADLYERLKAHQHALLTPFDLFKTLIALKDLSTAQAPTSERRRRRHSLGASSGVKRAHKRLAILPPVPNANPNAPQPFAVPLDVALQPAALNLPTILVESLLPGAEAPNPVPTAAPAQPPTAAAAATSPTLQPGAAVATASISQLKVVDGVSYKQKFKKLSLLDRHTRDQLDRSCIEAGIPDNYCVCHQFEPVHADRLDVLGAAYYLVYAHLESKLHNHLGICRRLDLDKIQQAEVFDFKLESKKGARRRRRQSGPIAGLFGNSLTVETMSTSKPSSVRKQDAASENSNDKSNQLPNREYSVMFATKPGGGLFQEVVRFYGSNITSCEEAIGKAKLIVDDKRATFDERRASVRTMNGACEFSVHSDSISRFNLYKDQSSCVKSNIELKKICYCNDLP